MFKRLFLLLTTISIFTFSCTKEDLASEHPLCQIRKIVREGGPTLTGTIDYIFDNQHKLTQLNQPLALVGNLHFDYDNQGRLFTIKEGDLIINKLIYQNNLVVQIDKFDNFDQLIDQAFFTYDSQNRLIEKRGFTSEYPFAVYEYEGQSINPKRKLIYGTPIPTPGDKTTDDGSGVLAPPGLELQIIYEYQYDNRINPQATLVGQPLSPFYYGQEAIIDMFEPITRNNIVYQKFQRKNGQGFFTYQEYFISYTYNTLYPATETHRKVEYNLDPSVLPIETFSSATYTYECIFGLRE